MSFNEHSVTVEYDRDQTILCFDQTWHDWSLIMFKSKVTLIRYASEKYDWLHNKEVVILGFLSSLR